MGRQLLRITIDETGQTMVIKLEGRVAGPWVAEVSDTWTAAAPRLAARKLSLDLREVTYLDAGAARVLGDIYAQTGAEFVTSTPWTQYLAEEIMRGTTQPIEGV
jgi:anti-anti-sigma regulatory factor